MLHLSIIVASISGMTENKDAVGDENDIEPEKNEKLEGELVANEKIEPKTERVGLDDVDSGDDTSDVDYTSLLARRTSSW